MSYLRTELHDIKKHFLFDSFISNTQTTIILLILFTYYFKIPYKDLDQSDGSNILPDTNIRVLLFGATSERAPLSS